MNDRSRILAIWIVSLVMCSMIEFAFQQAYGIFGIGIVCSIYLSIMIKQDLEKYEKEIYQKKKMKGGA